LRELPDIELLDAEGNPISVALVAPCPGGSCIFQQALLLLPNLPKVDSYPPQPGEVLLFLDWWYSTSEGARCPTETPKATQVKLSLRGTDSAAIVDVSSLSGGGIVQCIGKIQVVSYGNSA
jgi:hypothetical protein